MQSVRQVLSISAVLVCVAASPTASAASWRSPVAVHVPRHPSDLTNVRVSFHTRGYLPHGGYYYAVIAVERYRGHTREAPPPCAISSDMLKTQYGYANRHGSVALTLFAAKSVDDRWCSGGAYEGAIYAVPHAPLCSGANPYAVCSTDGYEFGGGCNFAEKVCGVVIRGRRYAYLDGLPKPIDTSTQIVGRFQIRFQ
jgi:hypothetical protein